MCGAKVVEKTTYLNDKLSSFLALHIRDEPWEAYRKKKGVKLVEIIIKFIAYHRALLAAWAFARLWFHVDTTWGHCCGTANKNEHNVMSWNLGALRDAPAIGTTLSSQGNLWFGQYLHSWESSLTFLPSQWNRRSLVLILASHYVTWHLCARIL